MPYLAPVVAAIGDVPGYCNGDAAVRRAVTVFGHEILVRKRGSGRAGQDRWHLAGGAHWRISRNDTALRRAGRSVSHPRRHWAYLC